jgi:hypothetical protein
MAGYTVMSWHCVGPAVESGISSACAFTIASTIAGNAWRRVALSAAVGAPVPPRAATTLSSMAALAWGGTICSSPSIVTV